MGVISGKGVYRVEEKGRVWGLCGVGKAESWLVVVQIFFGVITKNTKKKLKSIKLN